MPDAVAAPSVGAMLEAAAAELARAGVRGPRREAAHLWAAVAGTAPGAVWLRRDAPAARHLAERLQEVTDRRAAGVPFAYVVERASFRHLDLAVDRRVLIPRPETEGLIDLVLEWVRARPERHGGYSADIGAGCGCLALALATEGAFDRVIAVERSRAAAALTRENVARVRPAVPVEVREGDLMGPIAGDRCRVIVSNPPYLTEAEYMALDPSVRDHEPRDALVSGHDGMNATRALLAGAAHALEPDGLLALEIDERRATVVRGLAREYGWLDTRIYRDLFGRERYALATRGLDAVTTGGSA